MPSKKAASGKCATRWCRGYRSKGKSTCRKCQWRKMKAEDPIRYNYSYLKTNAKRRGKDFSLTLEQFRLFCAETGYDKMKGKTINSASIDRIDNTRGYHIDTT